MAFSPEIHTPSVDGSPKVRPIGAGRPANLRSKVTNGSRVFAVGGDGYSPWTRRWRDLVELHVSDASGTDTMSEAELSLCRRCATLEISLEQMEAAMSEGKEADPEIYARIASHLRRLLETLGLKRVARNVDDEDFLQRHFDRPFRPAPDAEDDDGMERDSGEAEMAASGAPSEASP